MVATLPNSYFPRSLGNVPWAGSAVSTGSVVGGKVLVASLGLKAGGMAAGAVTAGVGLAAMALLTWFQSAKRRGAQKVAATQIVDEAAPYLQANLDAWQASPKTEEDTYVAAAAASEVFDWIVSQEGCGNPSLGTAGQRCISERMCREGEAGCRWPWFDYYLTPITSYVPPPPPPVEANQLHSGNGNGNGLVADSGNSGGIFGGLFGGASAGAGESTSPTGPTGPDGKTLLILGLAGVGILMMTMGGKS